MSWIRRPRGDEGTMIPMILMAFAVAGLIVTGSIAAGSAFLAQRNLQSVCDGAALAGAQALSDSAYYAANRPELTELPLGDVQHAVDAYGARDSAGSGDPVRMQALVTDGGTTVHVACSTHVDIPFQSVFRPGGLDRSTTADARSQVERNG